MSANKDFKIRNVEVWGVGEKVVPEDSGERDPKKSILDEHNDAKVILQIAGKQQYSDGLREEECADDP